MALDIEKVKDLPFLATWDEESITFTWDFCSEDDLEKSSGDVVNRLEQEGIKEYNIDSFSEDLEEYAEYTLNLTIDTNGVTEDQLIKAMG